MTENKKCPSCKTEIDKDAKKCPHCHADLRSWISRHPFITLLIVIFIGIPILAGILSGTSSTSSSIEKKVKLSPEELTKLNDQIDMIAKDFDHTVDKFSDIEWYKNKDNPKPGTTGLSLAVTNDGAVFLVSQYHGDDWIFHKQVQVRIGDKVYTSEVGQVDTQVGNYGVYESVVYTQGEDSGIAEAIAKSGDQDVFVRLSGKYDKDFTLSKKDKLAILESYTLAVLLDKRNDNEQ